jgi:hypothetical protein
MKTFRPLQEKQIVKQRLPKSLYNPAKQFKHRDRGTQSGRTNIK